MLADEAQELSTMASEPAAWMDEFRPKLRWFATVKLLSSRRLERAGHNDPDEPDRIEAEWFAAHGSAQTQFWARFNQVAASNGFIRPKVGLAHLESRIDTWLARCWPTFVAIGMLILVLRRYSGRQGDSITRERTKA
jgi:hypothetical protein